MKRKYLLLVSLFVCSLSQAQIFETNFENWIADTIPADFYGPHSSLEVDSVIKMSGATYGNNLCQLINTESSHRRLNTNDNLSFTAGDAYEIKLWVKGKGDIRTNIYTTSYGTYNAYESINSSSLVQITQIVTVDSTVANGEIILSVRNTDPLSGHIQVDSMHVSPVSISTVTIRDIQETTAPNGDSPLNGQVVNVSGIVTAVKGSTGFWMQSDTLPWGGIYVYDNAGANLNIGDNVTFKGQVTEYSGLTEMIAVTGLTVTASGVSMPAVSLSIQDAISERYEGMLVKIWGKCSNTDIGFGEWELQENTGSDVVAIDDFMYKHTSLVLNNTYSVTGIAHYSFGAAKILPRDANDVISSLSSIKETLNANVAVYPQPANEFVTIVLDNKDEKVQNVQLFDIAGIEQNVSFNYQSSKVVIDLSSVKVGTFMLRIQTNNETYTKLVLKN